MFTMQHLLWIGLCAVMIAALSLCSVRKKWSLRRAGMVMTAICALSEVSKVLSNMVESPAGGMHLDPLCLPFHLCSLMIFVVLYLTFGRDGRARQVLINFISVVGTLGSVCAILIPTNGTDFTTPDAYQCFVYHAGLLWFALHLILSGRARLGSVRTLGENIGILLALTFVMLYINGALAAYDTNFFYLTRPPMENLPVLNLAAGWYAYFLRLIALAAGILTLFHLPFILRERTRTPKKQKQAA